MQNLGGSTPLQTGDTGSTSDSERLRAIQREYTALGTEEAAIKRRQLERDTGSTSDSERLRAIQREYTALGTEEAAIKRRQLERDILPALRRTKGSTFRKKDRRLYRRFLDFVWDGPYGYALFEECGFHFDNLPMLRLTVMSIGMDGLTIAGFFPCEKTEYMRIRTDVFMTLQSPNSAELFGRAKTESGGPDPEPVQEHSEPPDVK